MTGPEGRPGDPLPAWRDGTLGVDLGTSHTVAMLRRSDGRTRPLLFDGQPLLPSAVYLDTTHRLHVGRDALRLGQAEPARIEPHPKRHVDADRVLLGGVEVPVADLLAALLGAVAREAVATAGFLPPAVLTHPAAWGPTRRAVLTEALARAGWPATTRLVPEPVAAARYFADVLRRPVPVGSALAVFDLGGGTLDVAVVRNEGLGPDGRPRFAVAASGGADDLGGLDIDAALVDHLGKSLAGEEPEAWAVLTDPVTLAQWRARRQFWEDVRGAKEMLSRSALAPVPVPGVEHAAHLTRDELEAAAGPLIRRGVADAAAVIEAAGLTPPELAGLFLVGGSSRVPMVARLLHGELGIAPVVLEQPELPVAEGAVVSVAGVGESAGAEIVGADVGGGDWAAVGSASAGHAPGAVPTGDLPPTAAEGLAGSAAWSEAAAGVDSAAGEDGVRYRPGVAEAATPTPTPATVPTRPPGEGQPASGPPASSSPVPASSASAAPASAPTASASMPTASASASAASASTSPASASAAASALTPAAPTPESAASASTSPASASAAAPAPESAASASTSPASASAAAPDPGSAASASTSPASATAPITAASAPTSPAAARTPSASSDAGSPAAFPPPPPTPSGSEPQYAEPVDPWATGEAAAFAASGGSPLYPGSGAPAGASPPFPGSGAAPGASPPFPGSGAPADASPSFAGSGAPEGGAAPAFPGSGPPGHGAESWPASAEADHRPPGAGAAPVPPYRRKWVLLVAAATAVVVAAGVSLAVIFWPGHRSLDYRPLASFTPVTLAPAAPMSSGFQDAAVIGDRVYFASVTEQNVLEVVAADTSGKRLWASAAAGAAPRWEQMIALPDAVVVFTDSDATTRKRDMAVLDAGRGTLRWKRTIGDDDGVLFSAGVAVLVDRGERRLLGLRMADGRNQWEQRDVTTTSGTSTAVVAATTSADLAGPASASGTAFAPDLDDDTRIVQVSADKSFRVLDARSGDVETASRQGNADPNDEMLVHDGRFFVVDSNGTTETLLVYDLAKNSLPVILYGAPPGARMSELTPCGDERVCWVETTDFDVKQTRVAGVDAVKGGDVWRRPLPNTDRLVPVGDHLLAGQSTSPPQVALIDADGKQVWNLEGEAARLDGGNLMRFGRSLSTIPDDPTLYGRHLGAEEVPLGALRDVRSQTCSWNTSVIACVADENFVVQRFAG